MNDPRLGGPAPTPAAESISTPVPAVPLADDTLQQDSQEKGDPAVRTVRATQPSNPPHVRGRRRGILTVGLALLAVAGFAIVSPPMAIFHATEVVSTAGDAPPLPVEIVRVGSVAGPELSQRYAGLLVARRESDLSFERGGRVTRIDVQEGSVVKQGDLLAELDQQDLDAAEQRIASELEAARALLSEFIAGPRTQSIRAAKARVDELSARAALAKMDADRQQQLAPRGATSRSELDAAVLGLQASEKSLVAAEALLEELTEGTRSEQVDAQRAKCSAIEARLREIEAQRADSRIVAPFAGTISARTIDEGVVVEPGTTVVHLVSDAMEAQIGLPPETARRLSPGDPVTLWSRDERRDAWIDRVEPTVRRQTRTRVIHLRFHRDQAPADARLFAEMADDGWVSGEVVQMQVPLQTRQAPDGKYWLPRSALVRGTRGLWTLLVVPGDEGSGICDRRNVAILKTDGEFALVQGMIKAGERVIADGLHRVTAAMPVTPSQADGDRSDQGSEENR